MANYANLLATIAANIYSNGNQEVTAAMVKSAVDAMVGSLGYGYQFRGAAAPSDNPGTPDQRVYFVAKSAGTYTNFGNISVSPDEVAILKWDSVWSKEIITINAISTIAPRLAAQDAEIASFEQAVRGLVENYPNVTIYGNVTNNPNNEDINTNENNQLQFADRSTLYGKGYKILRRNKTFAEQVTDIDTIYEIRYDFDLGGASVTIPAGCVLKFNGGTMINGVITLNGAIISAESNCFSNITFSDNCGNDEIRTSWFDSITTQVLKNIVEVLGRGKVIIIDRDVTIDNSPLSQQYQNIIDLYSNTRVKGDGNHTIIVNNNNAQFGFNGVFGNANTTTDLFDIAIEDIKLSLVGYTAYSHSLAFVKLHKSDTSHIDNVLIKNCEVQDAACLVYALKTRTTPTEDRSMRNLTIENCRAINVTWSGCTLDVKGAVVRNCYFYGNNTDSYDGISIHSGIDVVVENCIFEHFTNSGGFGVNIRNSPENGCGTKSVIIRDNIFRNFANSPFYIVTTTATGLDEPSYGVSDISILDNVVEDCNSALTITKTAAATKTPENIRICGNKLPGLYIVATAVLPIKNLFVENNNIIGAFSLSTITNGTILHNIVSIPEAKPRAIGYCINVTISENNISLDGASASLVISNSQYLSFLSNSIIGKTVITAPIWSKIVSNTFRGVVEITYDQTQYYRCVIADNIFVNNSTFNGRTFIDMELKSNKTKVLYTYDNGGGNIYNIVGDIVINVNNATKVIERCAAAGTPGTFNSIVQQ